MEKNTKVNLEAENLLTANSEAVDRAVKQAVKTALLKHKMLNNPVAIWRDGKVVLLQPEEIFPGED